MNAQSLKQTLSNIEHFQVHYSSDLTFTPDHRICKSSYNTYSIILKSFQSSISSSDEEIQHLLSNNGLLLLEGEEYGYHLKVSLQDSNDHDDIMQKHYNVYTNVRRITWDQICFEDLLPQPIKTLEYHWVRSINFRSMTTVINPVVI